MNLIIKETIEIAGVKRYLQFFPNEDKFIKLVNDHFINKTELWSKLPKLKFLKVFCQKVNKTDVVTLKEIYKAVVPYIAKELKETAVFPLYILHDEVFTDNKNRKKRKAKRTIFLTKSGMKVACNYSTVITAYFDENSSTFEMSFCNFYKKISEISNGKKYYDKKNNRERIISSPAFYSPEHWNANPFDIFDDLNRKRKTEQKKKLKVKAKPKPKIIAKTNKKEVEKNSFINVINQFLNLFR